MKGIITKSNSGFYNIYLEAEKTTIVSKTRGILRHQNIEPVVGDRVVIAKEDEAYVIIEVMERSNELIRPKIANIDYAIIVISVAEPELQDYLLDKYLAVLEFNDIKPVIILSKMDLLAPKNEATIQAVIEYYQKIGYPVFQMFDKKCQNQEALYALLSGKIASVLGQTGVGKSTFLNSISNDKWSLDLDTNEISKALGRGKHTTRIVELFPIEDFWVADTPGFSSFSVAEINATVLSDAFIEFSQYHCKFHNCVHINEKICGVKDAVEAGQIFKQRYDNYRKLYEEIKKGGKKIW